MPTIDPSLIPTITPGNIFERLTTDRSLNVRWLTATDPVLFSAMNRPMADITVRQLIIAKALDDINLRLSHQALFPFIITPKIEAGSSGELQLPGSWIWDMQVSIPAKWELLRLAKIKRISGTNTGGSESDQVTGKLRFIFSAQVKGSTAEVYLFYVDYQIDSFFTYQIKDIQPVTSAEESNPINSGEQETIAGFVTFRTLSLTNDDYLSFIKALAPPSDTTDSNSDGLFDTPAEYEMLSTPPGGYSQPDDFMEGSLSHGTGTTVNSAFNSVPSTDSDFQTWLSSSNYPFRIGMTRTSTSGITVPAAIFREFSLVVPAADQATADVSLQNHPVWLSSIERVNDLATQLKLMFSTHSINPDGTPLVVEFASLTLEKSMTPGTVVNIIPEEDLLEVETTDEANFLQGFGRGHVVLSSLWGDTTDTVDNFFESFLQVLDSPPKVTYAKTSALLSSYSLARIPPYTPTKGQHEALFGTTGRDRLTIAKNPSDSNRFVTEQDRGLGEEVDFRTLAGFPDDIREIESIEPLGYKATNNRPLVKLVIDASKDIDYDTYILPRLRCLYGRDPEFGDMWFTGTLFQIYNGSQWQSI